MYQHALCVYPYRGDPSDMGLLPPIGIELIAGILESRCRSIEVVDLRRRKGRTADFCRPETDLVCFSVNWDLEVDSVRREIRSVPPGAFILLGGRHVTEDVDGWFAACPNVSAIVRGDGEEAVEEMCRGEPLDGIPGFSFRRDDRIIHNPNRACGPIRDDLLPGRRFRDAPYQMGFKGIETGIEVDLVSSSRGCPFGCAFCSFNRNPWGKKREWSARSPESVVDEIGALRAPLIGFTDDLFTFDLDRVDRICDLLLERGIRKKYIINARLEIARRPELLRKMERAGFVLLLLGIESAQDKTLKAMKKGFDTEKIRKCFEVLRRSGMVLHGYFLLGAIGESPEEIFEIAPFARDLGLDTIALSVLRASPYTGLEDLVAATPGYAIAPDGKVYSEGLEPRQMRALRQRIYREFYKHGRFLGLFWKALRLGALRFLPRVLPRVPSLLLTEMRHNRSHRRRRRARVKAAAAAAQA